MPPKKSTKGKGKKKKGLVDAGPPVRSLYGPGSGNENREKQLLSSLPTRSDLVFVRFKQSDWVYSDFTVMVHASAPLHTLCRKIEEKHGRLAVGASGQTSLQLFRHPPNAKNELPPDQWHLRLDQVGMTGGTVEEQHQSIIYYNWIPATYSPLLQREPQLILAKLSEAEAEAIQEQKASEADFLSSLELMAAPAPPAASPVAASASAMEPGTLSRMVSGSSGPPSTQRQLSQLDSINRTVGTSL